MKVMENASATIDVRRCEDVVGAFGRNPLVRINRLMDARAPATD